MKQQRKNTGPEEKVTVEPTINRKKQGSIDSCIPQYVVYKQVIAMNIFKMRILI